MKKSYRMQSFVDGLRFSCESAIKENKMKIVLSFALILVAISTGVFVAIKSNNACELGRLQEINLSNFYSGVTASSSAFFARSFSLLINVAILVVVSLSPFLFVFAEVLFAYRAYLFGLNFALIFIFYGLGSMVTAIIVVLPCQLFTLLAFVMFYVLLQKINTNCKKYGHTDCNRFVFVLVFVALLLTINLAETLLLCLLNGRVILVI
jgi:hypothetical protein